MANKRRRNTEEEAKEEQTAKGEQKAKPRRGRSFGYTVGL